MSTAVGTQVRESGGLLEARQTPGGRMRVHAITAGLGSSGYYSPEVLREAATNGLIAKGTPLFLDHASETERHDRPERSVRDIAAVFTEAASYDETHQALVGEIQVFAPYRDLLVEMAPHIGLSISGSATDVTEGEHEGRRVPVIEGLARIDSVDFVTRAGRGGRVVELLESARATKRAIAHGVSEATANDTREALQTVLRDAYGRDRAGDTPGTYVWVRDFDDSTVWFEVDSAGDDAGLYAQPYTQSDGGAVALTGERTEVRVVTTYVPVAGPGATNESQETSTMSTSNDRELAEARSQLATYQRRDQARTILAEALTGQGVRFSDLEVRGLLADLPTTTVGALDEAAFRTQVREAVATKQQSAGWGTVSGFGGSPDGEHELTEADIDAAVAKAFGRPVES